MDGKEERRPRRAAEVPVAAWRRGSVQKAVAEQHVVWRKRLRHDPMVGPGRHGLDNNWVVLCLGAGRISVLWSGHWAVTFWPTIAGSEVFEEAGLQRMRAT